MIIKKTKHIHKFDHRKISRLSIYNYKCVNVLNKKEKKLKKSNKYAMQWLHDASAWN